MKYGIEQNENLIFKCANCGEIISNNGELNKNYCSNCGAPLTPIAIADYEDNKVKVRNQVISMLTNIALENKSDSLLEVLKVYNEDNE